jgi:hypothetical protein
MSPEAAPRRVGQRQVVVGAARRKARALFKQRESWAGATQDLDRHIAETGRNKVASSKCTLIVRWLPYNAQNRWHMKPA